MEDKQCSVSELQTMLSRFLGRPCYFHSLAVLPTERGHDWHIQMKSFLGQSAPLMILFVPFQPSMRFWATRCHARAPASQTETNGLPPPFFFSTRCCKQTTRWTTEKRIVLWIMSCDDISNLHKARECGPTSQLNYFVEILSSSIESILDTHCMLQ